MNLSKQVTKLRKSRKERLGLLLVFVFLVTASGAVAVGGILVNPNEQTRPMITTSEEHGFWQGKIQDMGGESAYEYFSIFFEDMQRDRRHEKAHVFGGALYLVEGVDGLVVCDSRFDYGCFHEFLGRAITELGVNSIPQLNQVCIQILGNKAGFCQHGVGHGIQSYFGYGPKDFDRAIELCGSLPGNDPTGGCAGGIYMEYNLRSMLAQERVIRESDDIFSPCSRLSDEHLGACYFWITQWWYESILAESSGFIDIYKALGQRCMSVNEHFRLECYQGIGNLLHEGEQENVLDICESVSANSVYIKACQQSTHPI